MKINIEAYDKHYHNDGKLVDNWQEGIKLLPFNSNPSSAFDNKCGLQGTTGEFFRIWTNDGSNAIENFKKDVIEPVTTYLTQVKDMDKDKVTDFIDILKDILYVNGILNITDSSFLKYIPLMPNDELITEKDRKKYSDGQKKLANYLLSMVDKVENPNTKTSCDNLFTKILKESLNSIEISNRNRFNSEYFILPFIKKQFNEDFKWMMKQEENVKVKYLHLLFHFYVCHEITQTIINLNSNRTNKIEGPEKLYFILSSEKASVNHDAVTKGWSNMVPKTTLDKIFGKSQALDILNTVLEGPVGFYHEVLEKLNETPFENNKDLCEELLYRYQKEKRKVYDNRDSEKASIEEIDTSVNNYGEFLNKLERLCVGLQSPSYKSRMRKKIIDVLSIRFLQRRRGNYVLTIDNEMLIFLIALVTKSEKVKLEKMYKLFNQYGFYFNRGTRIAIEDYLLKLNLLDRKSDSGEAQYVKVIL